MTIDTPKLTKKDDGDYIIQTEISIEGDPFNTETESFKLTISIDDDKSSNETSSSKDNET